MCFIISQARLELKQRFATLKVVLADSTRKTIKRDRLQPVSSVIQAISEKMRLGTFGDSYGLRQGDTKAEGQALRSNYTSPATWLRNDQPLDEQVSSGDEVHFSKRFFDLSPSEDLTNATDEHLSFFEARNQYIGGFYDAVIYKSIVIELSTILLLHRIGCQAKSVSTEVQDHLQSILPPKYLKKPKSALLASIASLYDTFQSQSWSLEPRSVKRRFMLTILRVPSFGSVSFAVDSARCGGSEYANVCLVLSSQFLQLVASRSPRLDKSLDVLYSVTLTRLTRKSVAKNTLSLIVDASSPQPLSIVFVAEFSHIIDEYIAGFLRMRASISKVGKLAPASPSGFGAGDPTKINTSSLESAVRSSLQMLKEIQTHLYCIVMQEETPLESAPDDSVLSSMTIGQWFSQAATHLASVSRLAINLTKQIRGTNFGDKDSNQRLIGSLVIFCHTIASIGRCIVKSTDHRMSSQQMICFITLALLDMGSRLISQATRPESLDLTNHSCRTSELSVCERVLPMACGLLDVAMRARLCDEASSVCMLICCRDIGVATSLITSDLLDSITESEPAFADFVREICEANSSFWWYCRLFQMASTVVLRQETELLGSLFSAVSVVSSTASSLVSRLMEKAADVSLDAHSQSSETLERLKWSWSCLDQSLKTFKFFSSHSEAPAGDLDPMLPVVLFGLMNSVDAFISIPPHTGNVPQNTVIKSAQAFVRTLAKQSSFAYSNLTVQVSAKIESAVDKLRSVEFSDSSRTSRRKSSRAPTVSKRAAPSAAIGIWDASIAAIYDIRPSGTSGKASTRYLLLNALALRSTLQTAGALRGTLVRYFDHVCMRNYLEQVDVMIHNFLDSLSTVILDPIGVAPADIFRDCSETLSTIFTAQESETRKLGFFHSVLRGQIARLVTGLDSFSPTPTHRELLSPLPSEISVRRGKRASLLIRPSSNGSFTSGTDVTQSGGYFVVAEGFNDVSAHIQKNADGSAEFLNEAALLRITSRLITHGDCPQLSTFKISITRSSNLAQPVFLKMFLSKRR
jgi:hypothetical protein